MDPVSSDDVVAVRFCRVWLLLLQLFLTLLLLVRFLLLLFNANLPRTNKVNRPARQSSEVDIYGHLQNVACLRFGYASAATSLFCEGSMVTFKTQRACSRFGYASATTSLFFEGSGEKKYLNERQKRFGLTRSTK